MGLGKTLQTVSFVNYLHKHCGAQGHGPTMVIAPLSTLQHWQREFQNWAGLNTVIYHGNQAARERIRRYEFFHERDLLPLLHKVAGDGGGGKGLDDFTPQNHVHAQSQLLKLCVGGGPRLKFDVVVVSYETLTSAGGRELRQIEWGMVAVDEAHRLKNMQSRLTKCLLEDVRSRNDARLLLTGTPIQNSSAELFALLHYLDPTGKTAGGCFSSIDAFKRSFGELREPAQVTALHDAIRPRLLRVELTLVQKKYYRALYERNTQVLQAGITRKANAPRLTNLAMQLRTCCNHPYLIPGVEQREYDELLARTAAAAMAGGDEAAAALAAGAGREGTQEAYIEALVAASGKLVLLDKLLPKLQAGGHKVLIFSQSKMVLELLVEYLTQRRYTFDSITGAVTGNKRQRAIDRYQNKESDSFIMLLTTRAGGVGINLTAADTVIIYDSDWNPQNDVQAQARCHRIGQTRAVTLYRLLARKSYEMEMFQVG
jgi:SNF2 family DNA or RNA helicase